MLFNMWFTRIVVVVVVGILANAEGDELEILDLIKLQDFCGHGLSGKCGEQIKNGCKTNATWLMYMIDASTKLQSGIFEGNIADYGSFDECLKIDVPEEDVRGKYCLGSATIYQSNEKSSSKPNLFKESENEILFGNGIQLTFAWCLPDSCSADDIAKIVPPRFANFAENQCQTKSSQPTLTTGDKLAISFFAIIAAVIIASTAYDYYLKLKTLEPKHNILLAFSFLSNGRSLFKISNNPNQIQCINGIRAITITWIIFAHTFYSRTLTTSLNTVDMYNWLISEEGMFILASTISVDTFFMLSGMVMVYAFLKSKPNGGFFNIPMYYLHRYLRLTPSMAVLLLVHVTLIKHMGSGPLWPYAKPLLVDFCVDYWWTTLLYIQNWVNVNQTCLGPTWYLSVDMQLFLLSPLILIPLKKYTKFTLSVVALLTCASIGACFHAGWVYNLSAFGLTSLDYGKMYYMATYTRAAPWLIGTIAGYFMYEIKSERIKFKPNKILVWGLWIASLAVMCTCLFAGNNLAHEDINNRALNSVYLAFVRPSWALAITWVIIACSTGYGGPVNSILSYWPFQFIAKISYNLYLLHLSILLVITFSSRAPTLFSPLWQMYFFWGHFIVISAISTIWTLAFESPIIILEKHLLGSANKKENKGSQANMTVTDSVRKV